MAPSRAAPTTSGELAADAPPAAATGVEIAGLCKRYGEVLALDLPRFHLAPRSTLALVGPSGCGKSTLLRVIAGLVEPDGGTVAIDGVPMTPAHRRALRLRLGYVIQEGGLFPHLTAGDNVTLVARDLGWARERIRARLDELLELARLPAELMRRYPAEMSGGQRQRVALMRALMLDPGLLLMDEPLAALDPMIRADLQEELRQDFERLRKTVLLVTHDLAEAAYLGHEIALMDQGRIVQRGTLAELRERPADPFVTRFLRAQRALAPEGR